jgi:hypothetical protein
VVLEMMPEMMPPEVMVSQMALRICRVCPARGAAPVHSFPATPVTEAERTGLVGPLSDFAPAD